MALINQKSPAEVTSDWIDVIKSSRAKPSPFEVVDADLILLRAWTDFFKEPYPVKCPFKTTPIREIRLDKAYTRLVQHRASFHGL